MTTRAEASTQGVEGATDALTGLGTRSTLLDDLAAAVKSDSARWTLAIFDIGGYFESRGRIDAEALVRDLAGHLRATLKDAAFYRPRETELAVLVNGAGAAAEQRLSDSVSAFAAREGQPEVVLAFGAATLPLEAGEPTVAMRIAESRNPLRKSRRRERRQFPRNS